MMVLAALASPSALITSVTYAACVLESELHHAGQSIHNYGLIGE